MSEPKRFISTLSPEELTTCEKHFPLLYNYMVAEKGAEKFVEIREMTSGFYHSSRSIAYKFNKPISKMG